MKGNIARAMSSTSFKFSIYRCQRSVEGFKNGLASYAVYGSYLWQDFMASCLRFILFDLIIGE